MRKYIAELVGTFGLVFVGTGAIVVSEHSQSFGIVGIALAFGLIVTTMIYVFGNISGSHINPAVTLSFALDKAMTKKDTVYYIIFQIIGAVLASFLLSILFPDNKNLGLTKVSGTIAQSFVMEVVSTFLMMLVILGVTRQGNKETKALAGIIIGGIVLALIFVAGPISGGSFNPARSLGPAIVTGNFEHIWLYLLAPTLGAVIALFTWRFVKN